MRRAVLLSLCLVPWLAVEAPAQKVGEDLPGSFQMYNVTGKYKGRFHCLVTEHGLNPGVVVFIRDSKIDASTAEVVRSLLGMLDNAVDKNPNTRLGGFVVFVPEDLPDVARLDDKREQIESTLADLHRDLKLSKLPFVLSSPADLTRKDDKTKKDKYELDKGAYVVVVLYDRYKTVAIHNLPKDKLKDKKTVMELKDDLAKKLGATRE